MTLHTGINIPPQCTTMLELARVQRPHEVFPQTVILFTKYTVDPNHGSNATKIYENRFYHK